MNERPNERKNDRMNERTDRRTEEPSGRQAGKKADRRAGGQASGRGLQPSFITLFCEPLARDHALALFLLPRLLMRAMKMSCHQQVCLVKDFVAVALGSRPRSELFLQLRRWRSRNFELLKSARGGSRESVAINLALLPPSNWPANYSFMTAQLSEKRRNELVVAVLSRTKTPGGGRKPAKGSAA